MLSLPLRGGTIGLELAFGPEILPRPVGGPAVPRRLIAVLAVTRVLSPRAMASLPGSAPGTFPAGTVSRRMALVVGEGPLAPRTVVAAVIPVVAGPVVPAEIRPVPE